ncbi:hypothetical protein ACTXT7_012494 [Hymenolepis weldensis]
MLHSCSIRGIVTIKPSASVELPNPVAAEDATSSFPDPIHDSKPGEFFKSRYNKHKYVFTVNLAKWDGKREFFALSKSWVLPNMKVLPEDFAEFTYSETVHVMKEYLDRTSPSSMATLAASNLWPSKMRTNTSCRP